METLARHIGYLVFLLNRSASVASDRLPHHDATDRVLSVEALKRELLMDLLADIILPIGDLEDRRLAILERLDAQSVLLHRRLERRRRGTRARVRSEQAP